MASSNRWRIVGLCFLMALLAAWGTLAAAAAPANGPAALTAPLASVKVAPAAQPAEDEPPLIGYPCGDGAQPLPWTICLYGYFVDSGGKLVDVASGLDVTVTYRDEATGLTGTKSDVTRVRPGENVASYALDISSLEPDYMGEVTLAIEGYGEYEVIVNPDMLTQNLRFDVPVGQPSARGRAAAPPDGVWGYVVDFEHNAPIAGVVVTISSGAGENAASLTAKTTDDPALPEPYYAFSATDLDAAGIDLTQPLFVEAQYNGDRVARTVKLTDEGEAEQVNLFTGWMCDSEDGRDLLPQVGSDTGAPPLPETTGADGLPDFGCFWGYVDGVSPEVGKVEVRLEIAGQTVTGLANDFQQPEDDRLRYGLVVPEIEALARRPITISAVLVGSRDMTGAALVTTTVNLDAVHSQQTDLTLNVSRRLGELGYDNGMLSLVVTNDHVYAASENGLIEFNDQTATGSPRVVEGGPGHNPVTDLALGRDGSIWVVSLGRVYRYWPAVDPALSRWEAYDADKTGRDVTDIATNGMAVWFGNAAGELFGFDPEREPEWQTLFNTNIGSVYGLSVSPTGVVWVFGASGQGYYVPSLGDEGWQASDVDIPDVSNLDVYDPVATVDGVWLTTGNYDCYGVVFGELTPAGGIEWHQLTTENSGLHNDCLSTIDATKSGTVWFLSWDGASRYDPVADQWSRPIASTLTIEYAVTVDESESALWVGRMNGVDRLSLNNGEIQKQFRRTNLYAALTSNSHAVVADNTTLFVGHRGEPDAVISRYDSETLEFHGTLVGGLVDGQNWVRALAIDDVNHSLWAGVYGRGVSNYIEGAATPWVSFDTASGLISDTVYDIATHEGRVWIATEAGISVLTLDGLKWQHFPGRYLDDPATNGFDVEDVNEDLLIDPHGRVWLSGDKGLQVYLGGWLSCDSKPVYSMDYNPVTGAVWALGQDVAGNQLWLDAYTIDLIGIDILICANERIVSTTARGSATFAIDRNGDAWVGVGPCDGDNELAVTLEPGVYLYDSIWGIWREIDSASSGCRDRQLDANLARDRMILRDGSNAELISLTVGPKEPDLRLSLSAPTEWTDGQLRYTLTLTNTGVRPATGTALTLDLPPGVTFASATCAGGPANCVPAGSDPLTWTLGDVAPEQVVTVRVVTTVNDPAPIGATLAATATVTTTAAESYTPNNTAGPTATLVRDARPDARVTITGPERFTPGEEAVLTVRADNVGGSGIANAQVTLVLGSHLSSDEELTWTIASLPPRDPATGEMTVAEKTFTVRVAANAPPNTRLAASATINSPDDQQPPNNTARLALPTTLQDVRTLILVANTQMAEEYGAGWEMGAVTRLADHPKVNGLVVDVTAEPAVQAAYAGWDRARTESGDVNTAANDVARAIGDLIATKRASHPTIAYVVIVGGDHIIPFKRIADASASGWRESDYAAAFLSPDTTVYEALAADTFLTDDCYTDTEPTPVTAPGWTEERELCQPELPTGRLVETPAEIAAAIDAFITLDGEIRLTSAIVGSTAGSDDAENLKDDARLTLDLDDDQCRILRQAGLNPRCRQSNKRFRESVLGTPFHSLWAAQHSSHYGAGDYRSSDVQTSTTNFVGRLLATIGCHAGLSVPPRGDTSEAIDYDMAQAWLGRGGFLVGGTAYGYGSKAGIGYSESFLQALTTELTRGGSAEVGPAMLRAKQHYVTRHLRSFTHLDEKVVLPITLYGLPMLRVRTPKASGPATPAVSEVRLAASTIISPLLPVDPAHFRFNRTAFGSFFDYDGGVFEQAGRPVEPAHDVEVPVVLQGHVVRGVLMRSAIFTSTVPFTPYRGQPWALSAGDEACGQPGQPECMVYLPIAAGRTVAPAAAWDHALPFTFGYFDSGDGASAYVFTILGAYDETTGEERRYNHLALDVIYGLGDDTQPPAIVQSDSYDAYGHIALAVRANDADGIAQVVGLCEYAAAGRLESVDLRWNGARWAGRCPALGDVTRTLVQVVDGAGNVTISNWQTPPTAMLNGPDLSIESVVATRDGIEIVIRNVGTVAVTPAQSFWVDAYLEPSRPPSAVNDRWDALADYGAAWEVFLTIAPGEAVTLRTGDSQMHPAYSRLPERLPVGAAVYAHVDVWNDATAYGAAEETHEMAAGPYNNIFGPVEVGGTNRATDAAPAVNTAPGTAPARPEVVR